MSRNLSVALILIALIVIVLLVNNSGRTSIDFLLFAIRPPTAMALLGFTGIGVIIGLLLR